MSISLAQAKHPDEEEEELVEEDDLDETEETEPAKHNNLNNCPALSIGPT